MKNKRSIKSKLVHNTLSIEEKCRENSKQIQMLSEYKKAVDQSTIISMTDKNGIITYVNDAFVKVSGYKKHELIGRSHSIVRHADTPSGLFEVLWKTILNKQVWHGILKNRTKDGQTYYVDTTISTILANDGEIEKFIAIRYDITKVFEQEQLINRQFIDRLTGLPNRLKLIHDLERKEHTSLGIFNIDAFHDFNKLYGYRVGDEILKSLAVYLSEIINKDQKQIYKLHGDAFVLACRDSCDEEGCKEMITTLLQNISENLFKIGEHEIYLSMTAGVSYGNDIDILTNANIALNNAKKQKLPFLFYNLTKKDEKHYANNQKMIKTLKFALSNDLVIPYFQPIYNNDTLKIDKYEVLMRIMNEAGEVISPYFFLDIAKRVKIYADLTKTIIRKAFEMFQDKDITFTVNISIEDIRNTVTQAYIIEMLSRFSRPHNVVFEIVESEEIEEYTLMKEFVKEIKKYGANIAIDDFGSGYSNFIHLLELEPRFIKIDGSIIKNILHDRNSQILTQTIVSMANKLKMKVIAEFVSSKEILDAVMSIGIGHSQGYYLGEPKPLLVECDEKDEAVSRVDTVLDTKEPNAIENQLILLGAIVESSLNEIYIFDSQSLYFTYVNQAVQDNLGYSLEEMKSMTPVDIKPEHTMESFLKIIESLQNGSKEYLDFNTTHQRKNGSTYIVKIRLRITNINGIKQFTVIAQNITKQVHLEKELKKLAMTDSLTGIDNRYSINKELDIEIQRAKRYHRTFACMMIDIDHFKFINDNYGHDVGDNVLIEFTTTVSKQIRQSDRFGRWGGEEFILILPELNKEQAVIFSQKLRVDIANYVFKNALHVTVSCGVTIFNQNDTKKDVLKRADTALYQAKDGGRNKVVFY